MYQYQRTAKLSLHEIIAKLDFTDGMLQFFSGPLELYTYASSINDFPSPMGIIGDPAIFAG
jgi:hypothetical protein